MLKKKATSWTKQTAIQWLIRLVSVDSNMPISTIIGKAITSFNWEKMLATTGDTATYMQYAYARIFGIFRKGNVDIDTLRQTSTPVRITNAQERALCLQLLRFPEAIDDVATDFRPNLLTQYLFETANCFSVFHRDCPVLKAAEEQTRTSRLVLCDLTARVLKLGLSLLGIGTCEQM